MIYTLALNPAIDRTFWVEKIDYEESNRVHQECRYAGGKGIDVSRVLTNLGIPNIAMGFIGGFAGDELEYRLTNEGVHTAFLRISGETRTNIIVHESSTGRQILLTASGPEVTPHELGSLLKRMQRLENPTIVVIGGSLPPGVHPEVYRKIISMLKQRGVTTLLDADGDALRIGIEGGPDYIKPNIHELSELVGRDLAGIEDIQRAAEEVRGHGVGTVLTSMGPQGIVMVGEGEPSWAIPPKIKAVNTVGVGDSAVAGFIYGLASGLDLRRSLVYATAAGTATTLKPGTARCTKEDVMEMLPRIRFEKLPRGEG